MNPHAHLPKNFDTLEVGAWYMDGRGKIHFCVRYDPFSPIGLEFITDTLLRFYPRGEMFSSAKTDFDLTHRVNPDGSLWTDEAPQSQTPDPESPATPRITVRSVTLELSQTLPSGEEQAIIVEVTGQGEQIITADPSWTNGAVGLSDLISTATSCLSHAKLRIASIAEGLI